MYGAVSDASSTPPAPSLAAPEGPSALGALRFAFADRHWLVNALVGVLLMMLPVIGPIALLGWRAEIAQRLARGHRDPIPKLELGDLVHYLTRGLQPFLVGLVVQLPLTMVLMALGAAVFGATAAVRSMTDEPLAIGAVMASASLVTLPVTIVLGLLATSATGAAELTENFAASVAFGRLGAFLRRTALAQILHGTIFSFLTLGLVLAGLLLCFVGLYPVVILVHVAQVHLHWQYYRTYLARGGEPYPIAAPQLLPSEAVSAGGQRVGYGAPPY